MPVFGLNNDIPMLYEPPMHANFWCTACGRKSSHTLNQESMGGMFVGRMNIKHTLNRCFLGRMIYYITH